LESIGSSAFGGCSGATKLIIPKGNLKSIGNWAFTGCVKINRVDPDNVENLRMMVFMKCIGLREVILPQYIKEISEGLFLQCTQLEKITLPQYVETIGKDAFTNCSDMEKISLPDVLRCIKKYPFLSRDLERIKIPPGVIEIESGAFQGCIKLARVDLPNIETIEECLFMDCESLKGITLPSSITKTMYIFGENCNSQTGTPNWKECI
jgi:hypothetical protein